MVSYRILLIIVLLHCFTKESVVISICILPVLICANRTSNRCLFDSLMRNGFLLYIQSAFTYNDSETVLKTRSSITPVHHETLPQNLQFTSILSHLIQVNFNVTAKTWLIKFPRNILPEANLMITTCISTPHILQLFTQLLQSLQSTQDKFALTRIVVIPSTAKFTQL